MDGRIPSGSKILDRMLEGGYETDIITTIYGPAGSGKTILCLLCAISIARKDKKIIYIESNVGPETFPKGFYAERDGLSLLSLYVLETKAGFFENAKIKIGDSAEF